MVLVLIVGPPAVGKMAVGLELEGQTGLKLFHNHMSIELALKFFAYGTPPFTRLVGEIRRQILGGVAASAGPGLIFTLAWDFDDPNDTDAAESYASIFEAAGHEIIYVELEASLEERLKRNATPLRLAEKPSKRDVDASGSRLIAASERHRLNSRGELDSKAAYLRIDNTHRTACEVAQSICRRFNLVGTRLTPAAGVEEMRAAGLPL